MTDEELIEQLRDGCNLQQRDGERAANRIEALVKERDEWRGRASDSCEEAEKWFRKYGVEQERAERLEAENAKLKQMWWDAGDVTDLAGTIADLKAKLNKVEGGYGRVEEAIIMADPDFDGDSSHPDCASRLIASVERLRARSDAGKATTHFEAGLTQALKIIASIGYGASNDVDLGHEEAYHAVERYLKDWKILGGV
jgi:hypothetical protein